MGGVEIVVKVESLTGRVRLPCRGCQNPGMPMVLRSGPYRFYFDSHEPNEPPHIHVDRDDSSAKFWIDPVQLAASFGFRAREVRGYNYW